MAAYPVQCCVNSFHTSSSPVLNANVLCRGTDKCFPAQICVISLTDWLTTCQYRDVCHLRQTILFDHHIVEGSTICATPTLGPHLSEAPFHIQQVDLHHEPVTARAVHKPSITGFL